MCKSAIIFQFSLSNVKHAKYKLVSKYKNACTYVSKRREHYRMFLVN